MGEFVFNITKIFFLLPSITTHEWNTIYNFLLWPVRGQKEDTEEEKVGGTNVLNKQNTYTK